MVWNYMNDSFRSNVFVAYPPETIACACIYLAARQLQIALPSSPPWFGLFGANEAEIQEICLTIMRLYTRSKPNVDKLEQTVNEIKKVHVEARLKAKGGIGSNNTPNSDSRPATPSKLDSPMAAQLRKMKTEDDRHTEHSFGKDLPARKRSHTPDSHDSRRSSRSRSRSIPSSRSGSPAPKKRFRTPPPKRTKDRTSDKPKYKYDSRYDHRNDKINNDKYSSYNDKYVDKYSSSGDKYSKDSRSSDKYYYDRYSSGNKKLSSDKSSSTKDRDYYTDNKEYKRKRAPSPIVFNVPSRSRSRSPAEQKASKKKYKEKHRSRSRSRSDDKIKRSKSKKHANGHRRSRSRDRGYSKKSA